MRLFQKIAFTATSKLSDSNSSSYAADSLMTEARCHCLKLYSHAMRPLRFSGACVWFRDVTSFFDASGMVCVRVETVSILTHQTHCSGFGKERWCDVLVDIVLYWGNEQDAERPQNNC